MFTVSTADALPPKTFVLLPKEEQWLVDELSHLVNSLQASPCLLQNLPQRQEGEEQDSGIMYATNSADCC